ncbi:MAG: hypothetical protein IKY59_00140 [Oscillospiraceae bacterium]|nr:hypothetical protein [Oscillospiraceae bacterium]
MIFSYRTRQFLRKLLSVLLVIVALLAIALVCLSAWLRRFIVYTPDGAKLDFSIVTPAPPAQTPTQPDRLDISIEFRDEDEVQAEQPVEIPRLSGYYVSSDMLKNDIPGLRAKLEQLPAGTAVLLDLKSYWGYFFYSSNLGPSSDSYLIAEMDALIQQLAQSDLYLIARLPALRDYEFAKNNTSCGLPTKKGYLWTDENGCYWLDPTNDGTLTHLIQITKELRSLGFDEVVFQNFYIPENTKIVFQGDRKEAIEKAAETLVTSCATDHFTVSFMGYTLDLKLPEKNCRLYLTDIAAAEVSDILSQVQIADTTRNVVFLALTNDTRYDVCGVLRPLELAH